ncbi:MAG: sugar phosphate isomerase/epimerase [Anaerolineae bacterium]|nr:sugar phosphate isomerase/epimerase [Phycisphaerae bacterium]
MTTRTGNFPIGLRRGWGDWQKNDLRSFLTWIKEHGFDAVDLMNVTRADLAAVQDAGLRLGSADLLDFGQIMASDTGKRRDVIAKNVQYVNDIGGAGVKAFFTCVIPGDATMPRSENYALAVECYSPIAEAAAKVGAKIAIEGWPGGAPHYASLCCTPETMRAFIRDVPGGAIGVNYDPSHLIRLGVDHVRFLREFLPQVHHVHAKDTELFEESIYELGRFQGSAFSKPHGFGEFNWRYTIPGKGAAHWSQISRVLKEGNYQGVVSVELEDENFNGTEQGEKSGFTNSLEFLRSV